MSVGRIITSQACIAEGAAWLSDRDADLARAISICAPLPLRLRNDGFAAVLNAIMGQQVSVASARAIWARLEAAGLTVEDTVAKAGEDDLRACGLSRQKIRYAHALVRAGIDYDALRKMPDEAVIATLTEVPGVGLWTAEIYAKFSLGRADTFAAGDLALQEGVRMLYRLDARPTASELRHRAEAWRPWRSVAARALWAYYALEKQRDGVQ